MLPEGSAQRCLLPELAAAPAPAFAQSSEPIKIGFSLALTGPLAPNGKQALLGAQIWQEEINAKGGLLGRKVELGQLRRPVQARQRSGHLYEAARRRQSRHRHGALWDQPERAGDADRDAEGQGVRRLLRARYQRRIPLSEILLDAADWSETAGSVYRGLLRGGGGTETETANAGAGIRRRRVRAQRLRRRPRKCQNLRLQDHLRQDLPAGHDRLLAGHPRAAGRQRRSCRGVLVSIELGRTGAVRERTRAQPEDVRRRHGRAAGNGVQGQAQVQAQRHRQLRNLGAVAEIDGAGAKRSSRNTRRAPRPPASIRSAIISAAGVMPTSS